MHFFFLFTAFMFPSPLHMERRRAYVWMNGWMDGWRGFSTQAGRNDIILSTYDIAFPFFFLSLRSLIKKGGGPVDYLLG